MEKAGVHLGLLDDCPSWQLKSVYFPSKFGGTPSWLCLEDLPSPEELMCGLCGKPTVFLCQIYAPFEEDPDNFHRTVFVFICKNASCQLRNESKHIKVFRSSLNRENKYYPPDPPCMKERPDKMFSISKWTNLCAVCGCIGSKICGKCKAITYCSKEHQVLDWKGRHKASCINGTVETTSEANLSNHLFPEFEIIMDEEDLKSADNATDGDVKLSELQSSNEDVPSGSLSHLSDTELEAFAKSDDDKVFQAFKQRLDLNPGQIIRYQRGGTPLWIAKEPKPDCVPDCEYCGSPRQFEFQIMPETLYLIKEQLVDWGVINIYTCEKSCTAGNRYKKEFVFKQDVTDD